MFSATDAAFSGFRAGREHFRTMLVWALLYGAMSFASLILIVTTMGPMLAELQAAGTDPDPDPAQALALLRRIAPLVVVLLPLCLLFYGVVYAAVNRIVLRPSDRGFAYLRFGPAEFRQIAVMILMGLIVTAAAIGGGVLVGVAASAATAVSGGLSAATGIVGVLALGAFLIVLGVRLSLAAALTFDTGRINIFGSWAITRGRFWGMLGAYVLALVLVAIFYMVMLAIMMIAALLLGGFEGVGDIYQPDLSSLRAVLTPSYIAAELVAVLAGPFLLLAMKAPAPSIYRALTSSGG
ncbi:MAG: hypothetical protein ACOY4K_14150 [Pseudomonadota bacterium]